jgi:hypothetical protein
MPLYSQGHVHSFPPIVLRSRSGLVKHTDKSRCGNSMHYWRGHFAALPGRGKPLI